MVAAGGGIIPCWIILAWLVSHARLRLALPCVLRGLPFCHSACHSAYICRVHRRMSGYAGVAGRCKHAVCTRLPEWAIRARHCYSSLWWFVALPMYGTSPISGFLTFFFVIVCVLRQGRLPNPIACAWEGHLHGIGLGKSTCHRPNKPLQPRLETHKRIGAGTSRRTSSCRHRRSPQSRNCLRKADHSPLNTHGHRVRAVQCPQRQNTATGCPTLTPAIRTLHKRVKSRCFMANADAGGGSLCGQRTCAALSAVKPLSVRLANGRGRRTRSGAVPGGTHGSTRATESLIGAGARELEIGVTWRTAIH